MCHSAQSILILHSPEQGESQNSGSWTHKPVGCYCLNRPSGHWRLCREYRYPPGEILKTVPNENQLYSLVWLIACVYRFQDLTSLSSRGALGHRDAFSSNSVAPNLDPTICRPDSSSYWCYRAILQSKLQHIPSTTSVLRNICDGHLA